MIRKAREEDCAALTALAFRSKAVWEYPEEWMVVFREELKAEASQITDLDPHLLERDGRICGYYMLKEHSSVLVELEHMFVEPD